MSREKNILVPDTIKLKLTSDLWVCSQIAATQSGTDHDPCDEIMKLQDGNLRRTDVQYHLTPFFSLICLFVCEVDLIFQ